MPKGICSQLVGEVQPLSKKGSGLPIVANTAPITALPRQPTITRPTRNELTSRRRGIKAYILKHQTDIISVLVTHSPNSFRQALTFGSSYILASPNSQHAILNMHEHMNTLFRSARSVVKLIGAVRNAEHFRVLAVPVDSAVKTSSLLSLAVDG